MSQSGFSGGLAAGLAVDSQPLVPPRPRSRKRPRHEELELKLAALRKDYADLHAGLFEAAQVYRRLCAPRLVRHGDFEIANEVFAARHLPGDFFTLAETDNGVSLALGDISGKGLAAGARSLHVGSEVRAPFGSSQQDRQGELRGDVIACASRSRVLKG
jgi:hypothetical protein